MRRDIKVDESGCSRICIQDMKVGDIGVTLGVTLAGSKGFLVMKLRNGDILVLDDGYVFRADDDRYKKSSLRVKIYPSGTKITITV